MHVQFGRLEAFATILDKKLCKPIRSCCAAREIFCKYTGIYLGAVFLSLARRNLIKHCLSPAHFQPISVKYPDIAASRKLKVC